MYTDDDYDNVQRFRHEDTCDWIFSRHEFQEWCSPTANFSKILWIHGGPGFGKSVLAGHMISHLNKTAAGSLAYFFCVSENEKKRFPYAVLKSWIAQLIQTNDKAVDVVEEIFNGNETRPPTTTELWKMFRSIGLTLPRITVVVDGFDECAQINPTIRVQTNDGQARFLRELVSELAKTHVNVLLISRDNVDIRTELTSELINKTPILFYEYGITKADTADDISVFSKSMIDGKLPRKSEDVRAEIATQAAEKCAGMFLMLQLLEDEVCLFGAHFQCS